MRKSIERQLMERSFEVRLRVLLPLCPEAVGLKVSLEKVVPLVASPDTQFVVG